MRSIPTVASALLALVVLVGCGTPASPAESTDSPSSAPSVAATASASPTPSPVPSASTPAEPEGSTDVAAELRAMLPSDLAAAVTSAELEGGSFLRIATTLVDSRGEDGSAAAQQAIAICEQARAIEGVEDVNLSEADGTSWILFGHPLVPAGACGEV